MPELNEAQQQDTGEGGRLRVGLIGVGGWGQRILRTLESMPRVQVRALCDPKVDFEPALSKLCRTFGAILSDPDVSAVLIATPEATHAELVLLALDAGKWVFVEKPLCVTGEQGTALERHPRSKTHLMVGHLLQFDSAFRALTLLDRFSRARQTLGPASDVRTEPTDVGGIERISSTRFSLPGSRPGRCAWWALAPHDVSVMNGIWGQAQRVRVERNGAALLARVEYATGVGELRLSTAAEQRIRTFSAKARAWGCLIDDTEERRVSFTGRHVGAELRLPATPPLLCELSAFERGIRRGALFPNVTQGLGVVKVLAAGQQSLDTGAEVDI